MKRTPTTPSQFFPPSYFAAAAGVPYHPREDEASRRRSQLCELEPHLLPTLNDTIERMTRPPSQLGREQPPRSKSTPKSILKSSDHHLQVRQQPTGPRKASRNLIPILPELVELAPTSPRPKIDPSLRTGRARSRTDPGTIPKGLSHARNLQPSGIPRRAGIPPTPATSRIPSAAQGGSERRQFVTSTEIASSSSSESQIPLTRYVKPKPLARTDSQSSTESPSQLRPPRFGLGLGLSGVDVAGKLSPHQRWATKIPSGESPLRHATSPSTRKPRRDSASKRPDQLPSRVDVEQRRQRELISLIHPNDSSEYDSHPSGSEGSEDQCLVSDPSGESLRSRFDDSGSEYSPVDEDATATLRKARRETKFEQTRSKVAIRQSRTVFAGDDNDLPTREDEQHTPRASSIPRQKKSQLRIYPATTVHDEFLEPESSTPASDEDASPPVSQAIRDRYSSELSRILATSIAAAARQRQAFGISSSPGLDGRPSNSADLLHADSEVSLGNRWQDDEWDDLETGSLLQRLNQTDSGQRSSADEFSLFSTQTRSSVSQESIYSASSPPTGRLTREIVVPESPPLIPSVRDQQWQSLERHVSDTFGEVEVQRQRLVWELTESEDSFVARLQNMIELFILPLRVKDTRMWVSGIPSDVTKLFDWLDDVVRVHMRLSSNLASRQAVDHPRLQVISEVFRSFVPRLEIYQPYLVKLEFTASVIDSLVHEGESDFGDFILLQEASERCQGWTLEKYLIEPVNRLAQYPDMFRKLLQLTPKSHPDYMSTLSLFHSAKLTIRVLSEVKDREDAYEFVKVACSSIKGISPHLAHRERRLLVRGRLTCVEVSNDEQAPLSLSGDDLTMPDAPVGQRVRVRRADKLSKAIHVWRGRSNSVKSTASTVVSFGTAPSTFDVRAPPAMSTPPPPPVVRVESEPIEVEAMVFTDLIVLATCVGGDGDGDLALVDGFGLSRAVSVLDEMDHYQRACLTLDLAPLTMRDVEEGHVRSTGPVVTVSMSLPARRDSAAPTLADWLAPLRRASQFTLRALASSHDALVSDRAVLQSSRPGPDPLCDKPSVRSILAAGLPMPKSPSMQMDESERGVGPSVEQLEREERGWWSKRFHEVFEELSALEGIAGVWS